MERVLRKWQELWKNSKRALRQGKMLKTLQRNTQAMISMEVLRVLIKTPLFLCPILPLTTLWLAQRATTLDKLLTPSEIMHSLQHKRRPTRVPCKTPVENTTKNKVLASTYQLFRRKAACCPRSKEAETKAQRWEVLTWQN